MKKTLAFMLAMLCIFTAIPPIAIGATDQDQVPQIITNDDMDEETSYELGDLNLDGKVNMDDTTALMRHVLMAESITDEKALELCEVTGDDAINMDDVTKLMRFVLKAIDKLDPHTWQDATCTEPMTCLDCGKTKGSPLGHSYTIATQHMEDDISNVQMVCERCGGDGQTYSNALHISEKNALYLMQVATDFSFKVVCDQGLSYVQENVKVVERFYSELYEEQLSQIAIELNITEIDSNLYLVAPKNEYEMAESYTAILSEDLCFEDYPGTTLHFSIQLLVDIWVVSEFEVR